jgi:hypothetical protein
MTYNLEETPKEGETMRTVVFGLLLLSSVCSLSAADGKLMHCFYFTTIDGATDADWQAFAKATEALPGKIPGLLGVWHGELRRPMSLVSTDRETTKKVRAGEANVTGPVGLITRQHGVCMEMADEATLKTYAEHPAHAEWMEIYSKVRVAGTTTVDIIGK